MNMSYAKMDIRKTLTTGVAPPRLSKTGSPEYIGKVAGCPVDICSAPTEAERRKLEKVLENPQVIKIPIVRNGKQSTLGYQPDVWKGWN